MMNVRSTANTSSKATLWKVFILILAIIVNVVLASRLLWGPQSLVSYRELASQYAEPGSYTHLDVYKRQAEGPP